MDMSINTSWLKDKFNESSPHSSVEVFELFIELHGTQRSIWRKAWAPEDVGGVKGFEEFLSSIIDPLSPEGSSNISWSLGFHAERFSHSQVNALIAYRFADNEIEES
jgi:hypothetical protein